MRELAHNPQQQKNSQYARNFQQPDAASKLTAEGLARRISDPEIRAKYVEAFQRSDFEGMLNYYKANYPRESIFRRHLTGSKGPDAGFDVSRLERYRATVGSAQQYLGLDR